MGRPIGNTEIYILDGELRAVPVGVKGELYIGGVGVGRGYWKRADLTSERFVAHPYGKRGGERLYRTGDIGRWREDGTIEFLGRGDDQVKIRGHRIELGEVEAVLREQLGAEQAAVVVREQAGNRRVVGYVVLGGGGQLGELSEVKRKLRERLPEYMIPAVVKQLESMPTTPNGKVDRKGLPEVGLERGELGSGYVAPESGVEQVLAEIWSQVLGVERVGVEDNFFDLGGHSLLSTQVVARIRKSFGTEILLRSLFEQPTVRDLSRVVEEAIRRGRGTVCSTGASGRWRQRATFRMWQQRLWFLQHPVPKQRGLQHSFCAAVRGELDHGF